MSNEELALLIQAGDNGFLPKLWEQVRHLIKLMAVRFHNKLNNRRGLDVDDLIQCGYFAVLKAVKQYDPAKGFKFTTFLNFTLKTAFCEAASCVNGHIDTLYAAVSLDEPIPTEDGNFTLLDTLEDCASEDCFTAIEESEWTKRLRAALDDALSILKEPDRRQLELSYYFGLNNKQIAEISGVSGMTVESHKQKSLRKIRSNRYHREVLRGFIFWYEDQNDYFKPWKAARR